MSTAEANAPKYGLVSIGEEAVEAFAALPDLPSLSETRAKRFQAVAASDLLAAFLRCPSPPWQAQRYLLGRGTAMDFA